MRFTTGNDLLFQKTSGMSLKTFENISDEIEVIRLLLVYEIDQDLN